MTELIFETFLGLEGIRVCTRKCYLKKKYDYCFIVITTRMRVTTNNIFVFAKLLTTLNVCKHLDNIIVLVS